MAPDEYIQALRQIRAEAQALYAMQCIARVELDQCVQSLFQMIDDQVDVAIRANASHLGQIAEGMDLEIQSLNTERGRYFGTVLHANNFGILIGNRSKAAVIVPLFDMISLVERPQPGDQLMVTYRNGKCEIRIRT